MYKKYKFIKTSTAGNTTGFILGKDAFQNKDFITNKIFSQNNLEVEQIAFVWKENDEIIMNMLGGEICGGATLASPIVFDISSNVVPINTANRKFEAEVLKVNEKEINVKFKFPLDIVQEIIFDKFSQALNLKGVVVNLKDIAYFVTNEKINIVKDFNLFKNLNLELKTEIIPALGIIEVSNQNSIKPTIWVKKIKTITEEQACTTGTIAAHLALLKTDEKWKQPSGEFISTEKTEKFIKIESNVKLLDSKELSFDIPYQN